MFGWFKAGAAPLSEYPTLPAGERIYAVGDIHGRSDLLDRLHRAIDADKAGTSDVATEIYLGDYVDRGPDSAGVIDRLLRRSATTATVRLRGNHEALFDGFLAGSVDPDEWRPVGGFETLLSYGLDVRSLAHAPRQIWVDAARDVVPREHRAFLSGLDVAFAAYGYYFAHAGIRPGIPLDDQAVDDLLWIRDAFLGDGRDHGAIVVHGHTPMMEPEFRPNRINLDTGAYATGRLTCLMIDRHGPRLIGDDDRIVRPVAAAPRGRSAGARSLFRSG